MLANDVRRGAVPTWGFGGGGGKWSRRGVGALVDVAEM